jgi:hypothetical protein
MSAGTSGRQERDRGLGLRRGVLLRAAKCRVCKAELDLGNNGQIRFGFRLTIAKGMRHDRRALTQGVRRALYAIAGPLNQTLALGLNCILLQSDQGSEKFVEECGMAVTALY